jgi:hypothetical protein
MRFNLLSKKLWSTLLCSMLMTAPLLAKKLTKAQKKELMKKGQITLYDDSGNKQGHFEVKMMPGSENIGDDAKKQWKEAGRLMGDFVEDESFWKDVFARSFLDGLSYGKDHMVEKGLGTLGDDYYDMKERNRQAEGGFSENRTKLKNFLRFSGKAFKRSLHTIWGAAVGPVYAILAPTGQLVYRPVAAGTKAIVGGTLMPVLLYTWNGVAWVVTQGRSEPRPGDMTITYVPEELPQSAQQSSK